MAGGDHRYPPEKARCGRGHAHRKRKIALLPVAGSAPEWGDTGHLTPDCIDERSGGWAGAESSSSHIHQQRIDPFRARAEIEGDSAG